jgi:hypothetical protein
MRPLGKIVSHLINSGAKDTVNHCKKNLIDLAIVMMMATIIFLGHIHFYLFSDWHRLS